MGGRDKPGHDVEVAKTGGAPGADRRQFRAAGLPEWNMIARTPILLSQYWRAVWRRRKG